LRILGQWLVVPFGLYAVGYYVVGPRIGVSENIKAIAGDRLTMLNNQVQRIVAPVTRPTHAKPIPDATPVTPGPEQAAPTAPPPADDVGPQVEVSVRSATPTRRTYRAATGDQPKPKRKPHRRPKPKPRPEVTDDGSYGGTQDQGTTTTGGGAGDPPTGG